MLIKHSKRTVRSGCPACGDTDLYYAHDTEKDSGGTYCFECEVSGQQVLIERDGSRHVCPSISKEAWQVGRSDGVPLPKGPFQMPETAVPDPNTSAIDALRTLIGGPTVDMETVAAMVKDAVDGVVYPTKTVIVRDDLRREIEGTTHVRVADVVTDLLAGEHVMMVGPAGTGKSTIAEQASEALRLAYYSISLSPMTPASQILGYMQAQGEYVRPLFREAYEHGGVFHFDEIDNSHPSVLAVINSALANGAMAFPDDMVKRHDDFRCVASANTYGRGADRAYVGRQQMDAATLDRFTIETIEIDEALESQLCLATGLEPAQVDRVLRFVRKLRASAEDKRMTVVLSPRASVGMCRLIAAGKAWESAVESRVRRGMSDADWSKLTSVN